MSSSELINETFIEAKTIEESLETRIKFNLGKLKISSLTGTNLYQLDAMYPNENYTPIIKYESNAKGFLKIETQKITSTITTTFSIDKLVNLFSSREKRNEAISGNTNEWNLKLTKEIPLELSIEGGASTQDIELGNMKLREFNLKTGASASTINFLEPNSERLNMKIESGASSFEAKGLGKANIDEFRFDGGVGKAVLNFSGVLKNTSLVEIEGGLGLIEIHIPRETGAIIRNKNKTPLSISSIPDSYTEKGEVYVNDRYKEGEAHLNINIDVALGSIKIIEI